MKVSATPASREERPKHQSPLPQTHPISTTPSQQLWPALPQRSPRPGGLHGTHRTAQPCAKTSWFQKSNISSLCRPSNLAGSAGEFDLEQRLRRRENQGLAVDMQEHAFLISAGTDHWESQAHAMLDAQCPKGKAWEAALLPNMPGICSPGHLAPSLQRSSDSFATQTTLSFRAPAFWLYYCFPTHCYHLAALCTSNPANSLAEASQSRQSVTHFLDFISVHFSCPHPGAYLGPCHHLVLLMSQFQSAPPMSTSPDDSPSAFIPPRRGTGLLNTTYSTAVWNGTIRDSLFILSFFCSTFVAQHSLTSMN